MNQQTRVLVINGSPKGDYSLTLQHSLYMLGQANDAEYRILQAGEALFAIQYETGWLEQAVKDIAWADAVIWNTPVYTMLVPWQLMRLVQLIKEAGQGSVFAGKYATSMMTCFHYYDHLAEDWIRSTSEDLGMFYLAGRTADNVDMLDEAHRASMRWFMQDFLEACRTRQPAERKFMPPPNESSPKFQPDMTKTDSPSAKTKDDSLRTVLLTDEVNKDKNLSSMIDVFVSAYPHPVEIIDINDFPYEAGCDGCLKCELMGECSRNDGFADFYINLVDTCDVLVFGMNIEDRYLALIWKHFLDRTFANGHRTSMMGKHTVYLVAGPLRSSPIVRQLLEGKDNVGRENCMGIIGDEYEDSEYLKRLLQHTAERLSQAALSKYQKSINFLGVGGMKIFRDLIYSMRGVVPDDHRFYKEKKLYDFPQKDLGRQFFNLGMGAAFKLKAVRTQAFERMPELYIKPQKEIVESGKE